MAKEEKLKSCLVIAPIDEEGSEIRHRSNQVLMHIIKPATEECGYEAIRADEISEPGIITSQVIQRLLDDDLVIADLTGRNPNVFYELAVRHTVKKPAVQIIQADESIPFDVVTTRTIHVNHRDLDSAASCKEELIKQIRFVEKDSNAIDSPISMAVDLKSLRQSENLLEKSNAEIISMFQEIRSLLMVLHMPERRPAQNPEEFTFLLLDYYKIITNISRLLYSVRIEESTENITPAMKLSLQKDLHDSLGILLEKIESMVNSADFSGYSVYSSRKLATILKDTRNHIDDIFKFT